MHGFCKFVMPKYLFLSTQLFFGNRPGILVCFFGVFSLERLGYSRPISC
jgi:hypothetical protein